MADEKRTPLQEFLEKYVSYVGVEATKQGLEKTPFDPKVKASAIQLIEAWESRNMPLEEARLNLRGGRDSATGKYVPATAEVLAESFNTLYPQIFEEAKSQALDFANHNIESMIYASRFRL